MSSILSHSHKRRGHARNHQATAQMISATPTSSTSSQYKVVVRNLPPTMTASMFLSLLVILPSLDQAIYQTSTILPPSTTSKITSYSSSSLKFEGEDEDKDGGKDEGKDEGLSTSLKTVCFIDKDNFYFSPSFSPTHAPTPVSVIDLTRPLCDSINPSPISAIATTKRNSRRLEYFSYQQGSIISKPTSSSFSSPSTFSIATLVFSHPSLVLALCEALEGVSIRMASTQLSLPGTLTIPAIHTLEQNKAPFSSSSLLPPRSSSTTLPIFIYFRDVLLQLPTKLLPWDCDIVLANSGKVIDQSIPSLLQFLECQTQLRPINTSSGTSVSSISITTNDVYDVFGHTKEHEKTKSVLKHDLPIYICTDRSITLPPISLSLALNPPVAVKSPTVLSKTTSTSISNSPSLFGGKKSRTGRNVDGTNGTNGTDRLDSIDSADGTGGTDGTDDLKNVDSTASYLAFSSWYHARSQKNTKKEAGKETEKMEKIDKNTATGKKKTVQSLDIPSLPIDHGLSIFTDPSFLAFAAHEKRTADDYGNAAAVTMATTATISASRETDVKDSSDNDHSRVLFSTLLRALPSTAMVTSSQKQTKSQQEQVGQLQSVASPALSTATSTAPSTTLSPTTTSDEIVKELPTAWFGSASDAFLLSALGIRTDVANSLTTFASSTVSSISPIPMTSSRTKTTTTRQRDKKQSQSSHTNLFSQASDYVISDEALHVARLLLHPTATPQSRMDSVLNASANDTTKEKSRGNGREKSSVGEKKVSKEALKDKMDDISRSGSGSGRNATEPKTKTISRGRNEEQDKQKGGKGKSKGKSKGKEKSTESEPEPELKTEKGKQKTKSSQSGEKEKEKDKEISGGTRVVLSSQAPAFVFPHASKAISISTPTPIPTPTAIFASTTVPRTRANKTDPVIVAAAFDSKHGSKPGSKLDSKLELKIQKDDTKNMKDTKDTKDKDTRRRGTNDISLPNSDAGTARGTGRGKQQANVSKPQSTLLSEPLLTTLISTNTLTTPSVGTNDKNERRGGRKATTTRVNVITDAVVDTASDIVKEQKQRPGDVGISKLSEEGNKTREKGREKEKGRERSRATTAATPKDVEKESYTIMKRLEQTSATSTSTSSLSANSSVFSPSPAAITSKTQPPVSSKPSLKSENNKSMTTKKKKNANAKKLDPSTASFSSLPPAVIFEEKAKTKIVDTRPGGSQNQNQKRLVEEGEKTTQKPTRSKREAKSEKVIVTIAEITQFASSTSPSSTTARISGSNSKLIPTAPAFVPSFGKK